MKNTLHFELCIRQIIPFIALCISAVIIYLIMEILCNRETILSLSLNLKHHDIKVFCWLCQELCTHQPVFYFHSVQSQQSLRIAVIPSMQPRETHVTRATYTTHACVLICAKDVFHGGIFVFVLFKAFSYFLSCLKVSLAVQNWVPFRDT